MQISSKLDVYDTVSASSNMDMEDRVSHLEQRLQLQEDEIQLLKAALADALRRLGYCEEQNQGMQQGAHLLVWKEIILQLYSTFSTVKMAHY
uniref:Uncharacterized protein n=1 Tax=Stegastes partitus TaxID=144197 RepID=A0A3B4ZY47_9TELE